MKKHKPLIYLIIISIVVLACFYYIQWIAPMFQNEIEQSPLYIVLLKSLPLIAGLLLSIILMRKAKISIPSPIPSIRKFNPLLMITGVILMYAAQITISPLINIIPQNYNILSINDNVAFLQSGFYFVLTVIFIYPIICEWLFRGIFQRNIDHYLNSTWAILISSLLFAMLNYGLSDMIFGFAAGLILASIYHLTDSLSTTIGVHMLFNCSSYLTLLLFGSTNIVYQTIVASTTERYTIIWTVAVILLVVMGWWVSLNQTFKTKRTLVKLERQIGEVQKNATAEDSSNY